MLGTLIVVALFLVPVTAMLPASDDGAALSLSASASESGVSVQISSDSPRDVHVVFSHENETSGPVVERVVALHAEGHATISIPDNEILRSGTLNVTLHDGDEPLPILHGSTDIVDADTLREKPPLAQATVTVNQDPSDRTLVVAPATVAPGWHHASMPLVTASGAVVVGYVKERQIDEATTTAGPLFARVSWDGGRTFGTEIFIGPEQGEPRGHWNMVEVNADHILFLLDSPRDDAFVEGVVLDAATRTLSKRTAYGADSRRPQEMSLTPSLAKLPDGSILMAAQHDGHGVIWRIQGDSLEEMARLEGRVHPQITASAHGVAALWTTPMTGEHPPELRVVRWASDGTILPAQTVEPITSMMHDLGANGISGPTTPRLDAAGNLHFSFGFAVIEDSWNYHSYYVRLPPVGPASLLRLDNLEADDGHAAAHAVALHGDRIWLLFSRGFEGQTFLRESINGGQDFGPITQVRPPDGRLFYTAGTGTTNRPLAILPDGRPIVVTSWYTPGSGDERLSAYPLYDPFREAQLEGGEVLIPNLAPSAHRSEDSMAGLAQISGGKRLPATSSLAPDDASQADQESNIEAAPRVSNRDIGGASAALLILGAVLAVGAKRR